MYSPLPDDWENSIRTGAKPILRADLYANPTVSVVTLSDLPVSEYQVLIDRNSAIRRSAQLTITSEELVGEIIDGNSSLQPYGAEIRLYIGYDVDELIPVGVFQIEELSWDEAEATIQVSLFDRSQGLQRTSYGLHMDASGKQALVFIEEQISGNLPYVAVLNNTGTQDIRFPGGTTYRSGVLQAIQEAANTFGAEVFFDVNGDAVINDTPYVDELTSNAQYDWLVDTGSTGVLISYSRKLTKKDTFNKIHVFGAPATNTTPQPYGFALDDTPGSPTYYGGPFGKADLRVERQELTTDGQCTTFALAQLRNSRGLSKSLDFTSLWNPALDAGDVLRVDYPNGIVELHLVDSIRYDESGAMSIETRAQQVP